MIRFAAILLAFLAGTAGHADPVQVNASEHVGYTRLTLEFKSLPEWNVEKSAVGYRLSFAQVLPLSFDLSRVFRTIDRKRITDVRATGNNVLEVDLNCACSLQTRSISDDAMVIDISSVENSAPKIQSFVSAIQTPKASMDYPETPEQFRSVTIGNAGRWPIISPVPSLEFELPQVYLTGNLPLFFDGSIGVGRNNAVEMMVQALSRAAAQGLVSTGGDAPQEIHEEFTRGDVVMRKTGQLSVTTGFDRAISSELQAVAPTSEGTACVPNKEINVASWGDTEDVHILGRLRAEAIAENGDVTSEGAVSLARYYLYLGFGSEARATAVFVNDSKDRDILLALAEIMDTGRSEAEAIAGQESCAGAVSLWSVLGRAPGSFTEQIDTQAVLSTFSALPAHLRTHLGPLLSERLHGAGLPEEARTAINAVTRGGNYTDESELATARLELEGTHDEAARDTLSELSNGTSITAAGALLELLRDAEARGMAPNPSWVDDAPTLVGALEGTEVAEQLNVAGLRGLIALGRFNEFRLALAENSPGLTADVRRDLATRALDTALGKADDGNFLTTEVGLSVFVQPDDLERSTRFAIAERLVDIGLAQRAVAYVQSTPQDVDELKTIARVLTANNQPSAALSVIRSSQVEAKELIEAAGLVAIGDDAGALDVFVGAGDMEEALAAALRLGDWSWITQYADDEIASATRSLVEENDVRSGENTTQNGALIENTRERRENMRALLSFVKPGRPE